jgi:toxin ParE1/3/4
MSQLYQVSPAASCDLDAVWDYIAQDKPGAAANFLNKLRDHFLMLAQNPLLGESREELLPNLRSFPVGNYVIYYRPESTRNYAVEILRVLHGGRDVNAVFRRR